METVGLIVAVLVLVAIGVAWWSRGGSQRRGRVGSDPTGAGADALVQPAPPQPTDLLVAPPVVPGENGDVPLRDWLCHEHPTNDHVWPDVVAEFYRRAAKDPEIASYFAGVDQATLQRHFLSTLLLVCGHGLTAGAVAQMRERHQGVRNEQGEPISGPVYERTVRALLGVLSEYGVPGSTMTQVFAVLAPLRAAIAPVEPRRA